MVDVHPFTRIKKWFSLNRLAILRQQYLALRDEAKPRTKKEEEEFAFFTGEFDRYYRKAERLAFWRVFFNIILYASIAVSVLSVIPFLHFLVTFIELGNAVIGSGLAFVAIFLLSVKINMHIQRMQACMYHLAYFYHSNPQRDSARALKRMSKVI